VLSKLLTRHLFTPEMASDRVRKFITNAYVKGMISCGTAENCNLEGNTSVFTKRRFRDSWNRTIVRRIAKVANHSLRIKARMRAPGARGANWFNERKSEFLRKKARTQSLYSLHLAGDFHETLETERTNAKPHLMRVMLVSNLDVQQRFANGTQGRLLSWFPDKLPQKRKRVSASCPELTARFMKEAAMDKKEMLADVDFMDINVRQENINNVPGNPAVQIQLGVVPSYGLTTHKVQALSIKHIVRGFLA